MLSHRSSLFDAHVDVVVDTVDGYLRNRAPSVDDAVVKARAYFARTRFDGGFSDAVYVEAGRICNARYSSI